MLNSETLARRFAAAKARPIPTGEKICKKCNVAKPYAEFSHHGGCRDGFRPDCKSCHSSYHKHQRANKERDYYRRYELKRKYGISFEEFKGMFDAQGGKCAICSTNDFTGRWKTLGVDHDHKTGEIRALLCHQCNVGIGNFNEDPDLLHRAAAYLNQHKRR